MDERKVLTDLEPVISEAWRRDDDDGVRREMLSSHLSHSISVRSRQTAMQATTRWPPLQRTTARYITSRGRWRHDATWWWRQRIRTSTDSCTHTYRHAYTTRKL